jgi:hypothetical protein
MSVFQMFGWGGGGGAGVPRNPGDLASSRTNKKY